MTTRLSVEDLVVRGPQQGFFAEAAWVEADGMRARAIKPWVRNAENHKNGRLESKGWREVPMPLYEYICNDCKKLFAEVLTIKEHETRKIRCPNCHSRKVETVIEPINVLTCRKSGSR